MSKTKPTSLACLELIDISVNHKGRKAGDGNQQTPVIPTTNDTAARVDEGEKTTESTSIHPVLSQVQCGALITWSYKSPEQN